MVLKKKQDYGFNGFHISTIPRAPRSVRRRGSVKKPVQESQICAIDLLATLAGKLLRESESSSASSNAAAGKDRINTSKDRIKQELQDDDKPLKGECLDPGSCEGIVFVSELASQSLSPKYTLKQFPYTVHDTGLDCTSTVASPDYLDKVGCDVKIETSQSKSIFVEVPCKVERGSPDYGETCGDLGIGTKIHQEAEVKESESLTVANRRHSKDSVELCMKNPAQINSDSNVKLPLSRGSIPNASFPKHRDDVQIGNTDDDEKSYWCKQHSTKIKAFRPSSFIGDQRIRKLLTSRYWKVAPKLKDCELSNTDGGIRPVFRKRKTCGTRKRYQRQNNFKRRKLFDGCMVVSSDGGISSESVTNSPEKIVNEKDGSAAMLHGASGLSSSVVSHQASFNSGDSHVKFSIKSFRVPELFIEVPETSTIGVLKKTVMEAVNSIFGGGLHVGMFLQGKKVRDDYRTLRQTGISHNDNLDSLGFALEPSPIQSSPPLHAEDPPLLLPSDTSQPLTRSPDPPTFDSRFSDATPDPSPMTNLGNQVVDKTNDSVPSPTDIVTDKTMLESKPLVSVPAMSLEALAVVPMNMKTNRSDIVQRRTRRPFSVSEVEALVHAVEELGTGRWRDVKLRAFDNAKHRTYVDLKDKWKTLVHTARISPQQRRGEPVPQELLDRVLCAHTYWCEHQAKQNGKHQVGTPRTTGPLAERDGIAQDV